MHAAQFQIFEQKQVQFEKKIKIALFRIETFVDL